MNELMSDKGVCSTAPATPGLLNKKNKKLKKMYIHFTYALFYVFKSNPKKPVEYYISKSSGNYEALYFHSARPLGQAVSWYWSNI